MKNFVFTCLFVVVSLFTFSQDNFPNILCMGKLTESFVIKNDTVKKNIKSNDEYCFIFNTEQSYMGHTLNTHQKSMGTIVNYGKDKDSVLMVCYVSNMRGKTNKVEYQFGKIDDTSFKMVEIISLKNKKIKNVFVVSMDFYYLQLP